MVRFDFVIFILAVHLDGKMYHIPVRLAFSPEMNIVRNNAVILKHREIIMSLQIRFAVVLDKPKLVMNTKHNVSAKVAVVCRLLD